MYHKSVHFFGHFSAFCRTKISMTSFNLVSWHLLYIRTRQKRTCKNCEFAAKRFFCVNKILNNKEIIKKDNQLICNVSIRSSVTRLGHFWKLKMTKIHAYVAQMLGKILDFLKVSFWTPEKCVFGFEENPQKNVFLRVSALIQL